MGEHAALHQKAPLGVTAAVFTVLKAMIGTGVLALAFETKSVGLAFATPALVVTALLNLLGTWRLAECIGILSHVEDDDSEGKSSENSESQVFEKEDDYGLGPVATISRQTLGIGAVWVSAACGLANQVGAAVSYYGVVVETIASKIAPRFNLEWNIESVRIAVCSVCCALALIKQMNSLAFLSMIALLSYCFVAACLGWYSIGRFRDGLAPEPNLWTPIHLENVGSFYGASIFAFEGIFLAQHVYADMQLGAHGRPFRKVLIISYSVCTVSFLFMAILGCEAYGSSISHIIFENFPEDSAAVMIIEVILVLVLFVSFALQMFPIFVFLDSRVYGVNLHKVVDVTDSQSESDSEGKLQNTNSGGAFKCRGRKKVGGIALRFATVITVCAIGVGVPRIEDVMGYVGCFALSTIGFILPALFHIVACKQTGRKITLRGWITDISLLVAGLLAIGLGVHKVMKKVFSL